MAVTNTLQIKATQYELLDIIFKMDTNPLHVVKLSALSEVGVCTVTL